MSAPEDYVAPRAPHSLRDVVIERRRQMEGEGFTAAQDDLLTAGELADGAVAYAYVAASLIRGANPRHVEPPVIWPFRDAMFKRSSIRRMLVKAAAMILAEIDRIDRSDRKGVAQ